MTSRDINLRVNLPVALATGLIVVAFCWLFRFPALSPELWNDVAAAAGLRPPLGTSGGLVRAFHLLAFAWLPPDAAFGAIRTAGWVSGGLVAFLAFQLLLQLCGGWVAYLGQSRKGRLIVLSAVSAATVAFCCGDAVWYASQGFGASTVQLLLALFATYATLRFAKTFRRRNAFAAMVAWAVLAGDSPLGVIGAMTLAVVIYRVERNRTEGALSERFANPLFRMVFRRFLTFTFLAVFLTVVVQELGSLQTLRGYAEMDWSSRAMSRFGAYFGAWKSYPLAAAGWKAWVLAFIACIAPCVVSRLLRDRSLDEEKFVPTVAIVAHALIGVVAWSQLCGVKGLWFANWFEGCGVNDPLLWAAFVFVSALTLTWTMLVVGASVFLKRPRAVAMFRYDDAAETPEGAAALTALERVRRLAVPLTALVPLAVVASAVPFRYEGTLRGMLSTIDDYLKETVEECATTARLVTDGALDAGLELEAFRRGRTLRTMSWMGNGARDLALRNRGLTAEDDLKASSLGAVNLLRTWVNDTPERLKDTAFQVAFGLWRKRNGGPQPIGLGTVAIPPGRKDEASLPSVADCGARARALAERVIRLYEQGDPDRAGTLAVREAFRFVQWRLSRFCAMRAESAARDRWGEDAAEEQKLSDRLDALNSSYRKMNEALGRASESKGALLTPREGLRLGLERADFKLAAKFAETLIIADPDDPHANFAIGMNHFFDESYARAEPYMKRCLAKRPEDPAVLNNLAVIELKLCRFDEAEGYVKRALEILPDSPQILRTAESIRKARGPRDDR